MWTLVLFIAVELKARWRKLRANPDAGYVSEAVIWTAVIIGVALVILGILASKLTAKTNEIDLGLTALTVFGIGVR